MLPKCLQRTVKHGDRGLVAWECTLYNKVCGVPRAVEYMYINAEHCKKILVYRVKSSVFCLYPPGNLIFMHYNAQVHTLRMNTSFLKAEGVEVLSLFWSVHRPQPHGIFVETFKSKDSRQETLQCQ